MRFIPQSAAAAFLAAMLCSAVTASAADITWNGSAGDGSFPTGANWNGGSAPANNSYQDYGVFSTTGTPGTVNLPSGRSVLGLKFNTAGWTVTGSTFNNVKVINSAGAGTNTVSQLVNLSGAATWTIGSGNTLVLGGLYERNYNLNVTGGGTLRVNATVGGYSGTVGSWGLRIQNATVRIASSSPYGAGTAGAAFLEHEGARLQLATTVSGAQALVGTRIVDSLGGGLIITEIGGGYVEVEPLTEVMPPVAGDWTLTFEDDFDGDTLDGTKWRVGQHWAGIAGAGANAPENITVSGGKLNIKSEQRAASFSGVNRSYATGEVSTFQNFRQRYGYYEARVKYPAVTGLWPAFWFMPDRGLYGWKDGYFRSYVKFDLTGVNPGTINTAELRMKVNTVESGGNKNVLFMKVEDDSWSESSITWNNAPTADPVFISQNWNQATAGTDMTVNVKDYVTQQMAGDKKISLMLADTYMLTKRVSFHSSEAATQADRPRLVINGVTYYATEDAYVRWGTLANNNYGSAATLEVEDSWDDTANTFNGGMEVDILESLGIWGPNETSHALHWDGYGGSHQSTGFHDLTFPATSDGFHTYGVYWEPGLLSFYVDGFKTAEWANSRVMSVDAYMILSLQLGGWDNNNAGAQVDDQVMEVDWVRAWSGTRAPSPGPDVIVDNADTGATTVTGTWTSSTANPNYYGANYAHDNDELKGSKSFAFNPTLAASGTYHVYARWTTGSNRATNVPIDIRKADGTTSTVVVNQKNSNGIWVPLGSYPLSTSNAKVTIRTTGTSGIVIADAVKFVRQ